MTGNWRNYAACLGVDSELFFPTAGVNSYAGQAQLAEAKAVCDRCPSRQPCLEWAMDALPYGVAGGMSEDERATLRGRRLTSWRRDLSGAR